MSLGTSAIVQTRKRKRENSELGSWKKQAFPPSSFWDNLSEIPLTRRALAELDRRNQTIVKSVKVSPRRKAKPLPYICTAIQRFARQGGPDLSDIRNYSKTMPKKGRSSSFKTSSSQGPSRKGSTNSKNSSPYDRNFDQHLKDNGIYPENFEGKEHLVPANFSVIQKRASEPREDLSVFTAADFAMFRKEQVAATCETQVTDLLRLYIEGDIKRPSERSGKRPFGNLTALTIDDMTPGNPDIYYGSSPTLISRAAKEKLGQLIIPSTKPDLPALPNFVVAIKGPGGSELVAQNQARYDGALCTRAMNAGRVAPDGNAYVITSIFHPNILTVYTSHAIVDRGRTEYLMTQVDTFATGNQAAFISAATAYRNLRDWAEEQRLARILELNRAFADDAVVASAGVISGNNQAIQVPQTKIQPDTTLLRRSSRQKRKHNS